MLKSVQGVYRQGKVELKETPADVQEETRVIVTFLAPGYIDLTERGIDQEQAANLRSRLGGFAEEWDSPEMAIYDDYDGQQSDL